MHVNGFYKARRCAVVMVVAMRDYFDLNKRKQMSVTIEKLDGLQRDVIIKLDDAEIEKSYAKRLQTEAARANMKGFRKGKVPVKVMEQQSGKIIRQHVVGEMIEVAFDKAVREDESKSCRNSSYNTTPRSVESCRATS